MNGGVQIALESTLQEKIGLGTEVVILDQGKTILFKKFDEITVLRTNPSLSYMEVKPDNMLLEKPLRY